MKKNYYYSETLLLDKITSIKNVSFVIFLLMNFLFINSTKAQTFTDNTPGSRTWTVPCDVTSITVQAWGAGGAGGAADNNPNGGSGGGGGGYSSYTVTVFPGQVINYTIGNDGDGGGGNGGNGSATTILALTANGGNGGNQNQGTAGTGGTATGGTTNITGTNGIVGTTTQGGAGGFSNGLAGGAARNTYGNGNDAANPGSGGGGGLRNCGGGCSGRDGGDGADGQITITYVSALQNYCTPSYTTGVRSISNVTFAGINNTTPNLVDSGPQYERFCDTGSVIQGSATNAISLKGNTNGNNTYYFRVYIDWDQNGTFGNNANEIYNIGTLTNSNGNGASAPLIGNIAVPAGATLGLTTMRVMFKGASYSGTPCEDGVRGQTEDYVLNVTASIPTITSLISTNGCVGSTIVINGTNFNGITAANVQIGGTAVSSITSFTSTQITAIIGGGTTGFVTVTTASGTATSDPEVFTVYTQSLAPTSISGTSTICNGDSTTLTLVGGTSGTGATAQWYSGSCGGTLEGTGNSIAVSPTTTTTYFVRYSGDCNSTTCASVIVTVNSAQSITTQPALTQTTCTDASVSFAITTSGTVSSYQWYNGVTPLSNGGNISGANTASLTINPVAIADASTDYYCVVSSPCALPITSDSAALIVHEKVNITNQPQVSQTFCSGTTASFSVTATGTGLNYQWYRGATMLVDGGNISGATSATLTLNPLTLTDASNAYYCMVSGTNPCASVASNNAILVVNESAIINIQPTITQTICEGLFASFSISATGGGLNYQWYKGATMLVDGAFVSGTTTNLLTINPITISDAAPDYYCVVSNGCTIGLSSDNVELLVNETPNIPNQALAICSEDNFNFTILNGIPTVATVVPANTTYSWAAPVMTGGMTGGTAGMNQTAINQTLDNPTSAPQTATYFITPTSGTTGNCIGDPFTLVVTVNPKPYINNITDDFCSEENFSFIPIDGSGNIIPVGTTYTWGIPVVTGGMTGGSAGTMLASINQTLSNTTNFDQTASYTITATSGTCAANTFSVILTIHPRPTVAGSILSQPICSGNPIASISITNPNGISGTIDYTWTRDNTTNTTGMPSSGNGNSISGSLSNATNIPQTSIFTLWATSDENCISNATTVSVIVNPIPNVAASPSSQPICSEDLITPILLTNPNTIAGTTLSWTRDNTTNVIGIAASGNGTSITGNLNNTANIPQTTTFTITAESNGCSTTINTVTITVNPKPTVSALPVTQTVCGSIPFGSIAITNPNGVAGTTYTWSRNNIVNVTGLANSGIGDTISGTLINNTNSNQTVTFTINAISGTCLATPITVDIIVLPTPLITVAPITQTRCHLQAITPLNFSNSNAVAGTTYTWIRDNTVNLTGIPNSGNGASLSGTFTNNTNSNQTSLFTITATAPNGCSTTTTASITVYAPLIAPTINAPQTVCVFSNPSILTFTTPATGGSGVYTYQWQSSADDITYNNIGGATNNTYQPPFVNGGTDNTFYRLRTTNICGVVISNVIFVEVVSNIGFSFGFDDDLSGPICSGSSFTPDINSIHFSTSAVRFNWTADSNYITPGTGGPVGNTGGSFFGFRTSSADIGPLTAVNNTNATVVTSVSIVPSVYNFPGPPSGSFICSTSPQIFNVTIRPIPVANVTASTTTICNVSGAGIEVTGNITDANMTFSWTRNNTTNVTGTNNNTSGNIAFGNTYNINPTLTNNTAVSQVVTFTITPRSNGCNGTPVIIAVTVLPTVTAGTITANQTLCSGGDPAEFTQLTAATGLNLSYQWQSSTDNITYNNIIGALGFIYDAGTLTQNTWFRRVVTSNVNGTNCTATTASLLITINTINPGTIGADQTICNGGNPAPFSSVSATGSGLISYQWQSNTTGCGGTWNNISGALSEIYDVPAGLTQTTYYRRIASSFLNSVSCSDYSNCITVFVNTVTSGTVGSDQTLCGNNPAAFTEISAATASGIITYQWQSNTTGCGGTWNDISGATATTYDAPAGLLVTTYYQRVTTSVLNGVSCTATSNCITVTANAVTSGTISGNRTICSGGDPTAFTETVAATGTNLSHQWQISTVTSAGPWVDISGATNPIYDVLGPITQTCYFRRVATASVNGSDCSAISNFVTVFVNAITAPTIDGDQTVCGTDDNPIEFTMPSPSIATGTIGYQWQSSTVSSSGPWTNITGATNDKYDASSVTQTTYYQVIATSILNSVLCSTISNYITVISFNKTWTGLVDTNWSIPGNWSPIGTPTINDCVIIPNVTNDPIISGTNYNAEAKSLTLLTNASLEITASNAITVNDEVTVHNTASFIIRNNASLVQVSNATNTGNITIEKITQPMYRYDYTYWGSPVSLASNFTLGMLSPLTLSDKYFSWIPTVANSFGNWFYESAATVMNPIKGYIVRAPQTYSPLISTKVTYTANFIGTPNNGDISCPIYFGGLPLANNNDKYNLLGNPYPSAVDAELFLSDPANKLVIDGTIYFWTHNSPPSAANVDPFYGDFVLNYAANDYASWNRMGGTGTTSAAGSGGNVPSGFIASGQGFFTKSTGTATSGDPVVFKNTMRANFNNNMFFRHAIVEASNRSEMSAGEKHRLWLNLINTGGTFNQILIGYADGATNGYDRDFDGVRFTDGNSITFYTVVPDKNLVIQGRALPFNTEDQIPLGYKSTLNDTFSIRIDHFDGLFDNQNIYVEDHLLNTIHDLKQSPYVFSSGIGTFDDRFVIRYTTAATLGNNNFETATSIISSINNEKLIIKSSELIKEIDLFDISGKLIQHYPLMVPSLDFGSSFNAAEGVYIVKVKLQNGSVVSQKLIYTK